MLRVPAAIALVGLSVLTLAACGSAPAGSATASCERPQSDASVLDFAVDAGDFGAPSVRLKAPLYVDDTIFTDRITGDGLRVTSDAQDVQFSIAFANGATGEQLPASNTDPRPLSMWRSAYEGLAKMMMCATEGSRIVGAVPASELSEQGAQTLGITEGQAVAVTIDLERVFLAAADGVPQYNDRRGMPSVVIAPDGRPGVIVPDAPAPAERTVELLKKGSGAVVGDDDAVRVHVLSVGWDSRTVTDSTWESGAPASVAPGSTAAFAPDLRGATVGSQLMVVVPGEGSGASATIYVVDVLGIDDPARTP